MSVVKSNDVNCTTPAANLIASGAANYSWTPVTGLNNAAIANPIATPDTSTTYSVSGTNEFNCTSTASVVVEVDKTGAPRFVVPNAFTPNNDGKNDCFGIERWGNAVIKQFSIYNRWGTLIFQASDPSQCWDGTWNGKPQNAGGYVYIIKATTLCGDVTRKGLLTLIR
jgi:gliding motility-associated-like protein